MIAPCSYLSGKADLAGLDCNRHSGRAGIYQSWASDGYRGGCLGISRGLVSLFMCFHPNSHFFLKASRKQHCMVCKDPSPDQGLNPRPDRSCESSITGPPRNPLTPHILTESVRKLWSPQPLVHQGIPHSSYRK